MAAKGDEPPSDPELGFLGAVDPLRRGKLSRRRCRQATVVRRRGLGYTDSASGLNKGGVGPVLSILSKVVPLAAILALLAVGARAQNVDIAAFFGTWEGNALSESEISVHFKLTSRDIGVTVEPAQDGFSLSWNTVQRQRGDPDNPTEELKAATIRFRQARPGLWQAAGNEDPIDSGKPYAWAYIEDQTLVVSILQIYPAGRHEVQVYRRTLTGGFMELEFSRVVNGRKVRSASGRLVKVGN